MIDPYHLWLGIPPTQRPPTHYQLLGISADEKNPSVIREAALRQTAHLRTYQAGPNAQMCAKLLNEVAQAQHVLSDSAKRKAYDVSLGKATTKAGTAPPPTRTTSAPSKAKSAPKRKKSSGARWILVTMFIVLLAVGGVAAWYFTAGPGTQAALTPGNTATTKSPGSVPATNAQPTQAITDPTQPKPTDRGEARPELKTEPTPDPKPKTDPEPKPDLRGMVRMAQLTADEPAGERKPSNAPLGGRPGDVRAPKLRPGKAPVPDDAALAMDEKVIRELFKADYAKKTAADRQALAGKLLKQGQDTKDNLTSRYALFREALTVAGQAGDPATALAAIDEMSKDFAVVPLQLKTAAVEGLTKGLTSATAKKAHIDALLAVADDALDAEQCAIALRLAKAAEPVARMTKNGNLIAAVQARIKEVDALNKEHEEYAKAAAILQQMPNDPSANTVVGKHLCFVKGRWEEGLVRLSLGDEGRLKDLAVQDLATPTDATAQARLGDSWFELAEAEKSPAKGALQARGAFWYESALPGLTGLSKSKAEKVLAGLTNRPAAGKMISFAAVKDLSDLAESKSLDAWSIKDGKLTGGKLSVLWFKQSLADDFCTRVVFTSGGAHLGITFGPEKVSEGGDFWMIEISPNGKLRLKESQGATLGPKDGATITPGRHAISAISTEGVLTVLVDGREAIACRQEAEIAKPTRMGLLTMTEDCGVEAVTFDSGNQRTGGTSPTTVVTVDSNSVIELFDENKVFLEAFAKSLGAGTIIVETKDRYRGQVSIRINASGGELNRYLANVPGWRYSIVERPNKPGEYRYITFAWKKKGGTGIMLQLMGPAGTWRYVAGTTAQDAARPGIRVASTPPAEWTVVTRDLFKDFGPITITGIALTPFDGEAGLFDAIYLSRSKPDK